MKSIKLQVIEEQEKIKMEQIKREIAISMYVFLLGIVIVGVNTALFPFPETILDYPLFSISGLTFVVEVYILIVYFTVLLYRTRIKQSIHKIHDLILRFKSQVLQVSSLTSLKSYKSQVLRLEIEV